MTNSPASPSSANGLIVYSGSVAGLGLELDELARLLEPEQRVSEPVRRVAELGREPVGLELALRREQQVHERRRDRPEHEQQRALRASRRCARSRAASRRARPPSSGRARRGAADVRELVREQALELGRRRRSRAAPVLTAIAELVAPRPAESARGKPSGIRYSRGFDHAGASREPLDGGVERRRLPGQAARARRPSPARRGRRTSTRPRRAAGRRRRRSSATR